MRRQTRYGLACTLAIAAACAGVTRAGNVAVEWDSSLVDALWSDSGSWLPPATVNNTATDNFLVTFNGGRAILTSAVTIADLTLNTAFSHGIRGDADLTVNNILTWNSGTISGVGQLNLLGNTVMSGVLNRNLESRTLNNAGSFQQNDGGVFIVNPNAVFNNQLGASHTVGGTSSLSAYNYKNAGTLTINSSAASSFMANMNNQATGTLNVAAGRLDLYGVNTSEGMIVVGADGRLEVWDSLAIQPTGSVTGTGTIYVPSVQAQVWNGDFGQFGGTLEVSNGNVTANTPFGGGVNTPTVLLSGFSSTLNLAGGAPQVDGILMTPGGNNSLLTIQGNTVAQDLDWSRGRMAGTGTTTVVGNSIFSGNTTATRTLDGRGLTMQGGGIWNSGGTVTLQNNALLTNAAGSTFQVTAGGTVSKGVGGGGIANAGVFSFSGSGVTAVAADFNNDGVIDLLAANATFTGNTVHGGKVTVAAGQTVTFGGTGATTHTFGPGSEISGQGNATFSGGSVSVGGIYNVSGGTTIAGSTFSMNSDPVATGPLTVNSGTANFNGGGILNVPALTLNNGTLNVPAGMEVAGNTVFGRGTVKGTSAAATVITLDGPLAMTNTSSGTRAVKNATVTLNDDVDYRTPFLLTEDAVFRQRLGSQWLVKTALTNITLDLKLGSQVDVGAGTELATEPAGTGMFNILSDGTASLRVDGTFSHQHNASGFVGPTLIGGGTVNVANGQVTFGGGADFDGDVVLGPDAAVTFNSPAPVVINTIRNSSGDPHDAKVKFSQTQATIVSEFHVPGGKITVTSAAVEWDLPLPPIENVFVGEDLELVNGAVRPPLPPAAPGDPIGKASIEGNAIIVGMQPSPTPFVTGPAGDPALLLNITGSMQTFDLDIRNTVVHIGGENSSASHSGLIQIENSNFYYNPDTDVVIEKGARVISQVLDWVNARGLNVGGKMEVKGNEPLPPPPPPFPFEPTELGVPVLVEPTGVVTFTGPTPAHTSIITALLENEGTIQVPGGTTIISAPTVNNGIINIGPDGTMVFEDGPGGPVEIGGTGSMQVEGTLEINVTGPVTGQTISGSGDVAIASKTEVALKTHVFPHALETSGRVLGTPAPFDTTVFVKVPGAPGDAGVAVGSDGPGTVELYVFDTSSGAEMALQGRGVDGDGNLSTGCQVVISAAPDSGGMNVERVGATDEGVRLGYAVMGVGDADQTVNLQGFIVNAHTSPFDLSVLGFVPDAISSPANGPGADGAASPASSPGLRVRAAAYGDAIVESDGSIVMGDDAVLTITGDLDLLGDFTTGPLALLEVQGDLTIAGDLFLDVPPDFAPAPGETFEIITAASVAGVFGNAADGSVVPTVDGLGSFMIAYTSDSVVLSNFVAVPEPGSLALLAIGGLGLLRRRR